VIGCVGALFTFVLLRQIAALSARNVLLAYHIAFLLGLLIYSFEFYIPQLLRLPILCTLPLVACPFLSLDVGSNSPMATSRVPVERAVGDSPISQADTSTGTVNGVAADSDRPIHKKSLVGWHATIAFSVFILLSCIIRSYMPYLSDNAALSFARSLTVVPMFLLACITITVVVLVPDDFDFSTMAKAIVLSGVVFFALVPIFGLNNFTVLVLTDAYRALCSLLFFAFLTGMSKQEPLFGIRNVGGCLIVFVLCGLAGWLVGVLLYFSNVDSEVLRIISSVQCALVILVYLLLFRQPEVGKYLNEAPAAMHHRLAGKGIDGAGDEKEQSRESEGRWKRRCRSLSAQYELTSREEEIFLLLAKGYRPQVISDKLSISYNTARAHIRNIYLKCAVHSQPELVTLIDEALSDGSDGSD
jgi:DNA-binding CsgD family transcriptional regulator